MAAFQPITLLKNAPQASQMGSAFSKRPRVRGSSSSSMSVSVFYGSQTGCAESIAQRVYGEALAKHLEAELLPLNEFQNSKVAGKPGHHIIIVCSTTGNGEAPENAGKFWRYVKRRTQPKDMLANLHFTVLGLGDTNYDKFCYMGKSIDKRMAELSATRFYPLCAADEAVGLEDQVEPWIDGLWAAFDKSCGVGNGSQPPSSEDNAPVETKVAPPQPIEPATSTPVVAASPSTYLPENLASYEKLFGPLSVPTEAPEDVPRLQSTLLSVQLLDPQAASAAELAKLSVETTETSSTNPFLAPITCAEYLTAPHSERKVLHLTLDIKDAGIKYTPGDSIGIKCPNRVADVDALLARLQLNGDQIVSIEASAASTTKKSSTKSSFTDRFPSPCSIRHVLTHCADILSSPKKASLRALATYCTNDEERARMLVLSSKSGATKYKEFISDQQLNFVELLELFPSCTPSLDHLLSLVPQLMPRYYSIASSPLANADQLTIALTVVEESVGPTKILRRGLCSNWLDSISQPLITSALNAPVVKVPMYLWPTSDFRLPATQEAPLLFIGPGTGVSPFMGFLQHRFLERQSLMPEQQTKEEIFLFFGCRRRADDWIFQRQMEAFAANKTIMKLFTAFSREKEEKYYVQHDLRANAALVCDVIQKSSGYVYVCGDGMAMARDVQQTLLEILQEHGGLTKETAEAQLAELTATGRYLRDIWG